MSGGCTYPYLATCLRQPWQLTPSVVVPILLVAVAFFAAFEALVQIGNVSASDSELRSQWLEWYCEDGPSDCIDLPAEIHFSNSTDSRRGFIRFLLPKSVPSCATIAWLYFPAVMAIVYSIVWQMLDDELRIDLAICDQFVSHRTSPYIIFVRYKLFPSTPTYLRQITWQHLFILLSSIIYVVVSLTSPFLQFNMVQYQQQAIQVGHIDPSSNFTPFKRGERAQFSNATGNRIVGAFYHHSEALVMKRDLAARLSDSTVQTSIYLDPLYVRAQQGLLLAVVVVGFVLLWRRARRHRLRCSSMPITERDDGLESPQDRPLRSKITDAWIWSPSAGLRHCVVYAS